MQVIAEFGEEEPRRYARSARSTAYLIALLAALLVTATTAAQEPPGSTDAQLVPAPADPLVPQEVSARSAALALELAAAERALTESRDDVQRAHLQEVRDVLRGIDALLRQQAELAGATATPSSSPKPPRELAPASLLALDRLYEAEFESEQKARRRAAALATKREALTAAKGRLEDAEKKRREARGELEQAPDAGARAVAERALEIRKLASRTAQERVHLRTLEIRAEQREHADATADSGLADQIAQMRDALARGEGEEDAGFVALTEREAEIRRSREVSERRLSTTDLRLDAAQKRFSRMADPPPELLEEVEALTAERDAIRQGIALFDARLERLVTERTIWRRWDAVLRGEATREELESWKTDVEERIDALEETEQRRRWQGTDLERRLETLQSRLRALPGDSRMRLVLEDQRKMLARLLEAERTEAAELAHDRRLSERLLAELRGRTGEVNLLEYAVKGVQSARDFWGYEVTAVDDSAITVGSLVLALLLASLGLWASRRGSSFIGRIAMDRFKIDAGAAHALQALSFYLLLVSFTLLALRAVHFPLTAFTVLGGALAIGIGFGSQNVMNNFISGLILMLERPVRVRDIIEVDGNHGTIERIGARSTQIRSQDGRHIVVPNSFFLESNVINWTLSDDLIRTSVKVGVIYGSPTRLVEELIRRVVFEEEKILKNPEPIIIFDDFGDNSLNFEVHFWVRARSPMQMRTVQSRVRFRIDELFRENELVIAFPQRDVHLDSVKPIEVRVLNGSGGIGAQ